MKHFIITIIALLSVLGLFAQNRTINGKVVDETGEPLPGTTVVAGGSYAITDTDGRFTLTAKTGDNVTVSCMGYDDFVFTVTNDSEAVTINMVPSAATMLNEAVSIGY